MKGQLVNLQSACEQARMSSAAWGSEIPFIYHDGLQTKQHVGRYGAVRRRADDELKNYDELGIQI